MKTHSAPKLLLGLLASASLLTSPPAVSAAAISPSAVGDAAVSASTSGRANLALASAGAVAFSSSDLTPDYASPRVNDGVINHSGNSWIPATTASTEYVGVAFSGPTSLSAVVWHGQTGYNGRSAGTWILQSTTDASPSGSSTWTEIGTYTYTEAGCASPMQRSFFAFPTVANVTGMRLVLQTAACGAQLAVQEFEAYAPVASPPEITSQPVGGTFVAGDIVTLTVSASGAESFQWSKNGAAIPGATSSSYTLGDLKTSDAGSYAVVVANAAGSVPSEPAVLQVTAAPTYASYLEAVLTDNPIHYYPLDETSGTTANDLGSLATTGGTYSGGFTLGQPSATERLGTCARFDGQNGSFVDLGLFHPGDNLTVEAWARLDTDARASSFHAIVARWDGSFELDFATTDTANLVIRRDGNGFGLAAGAAPSARGQWHHIVGVFGGGVLTIYVDGVKGSEQNIGGVLQNLGPTPDRIMIGATREGVLGFKGCIDEVAIYDYALSPVQIRSHFRAIQAGPPALTIQNAVIVSWPSFPPGYTLQSATQIEGPYQNYTGTVFAEDNLLKAAVPIGSTQKFFQLFKP